MTGRYGTAHKRRASATAHVESVHVGAHGTVPFPLFGTEIPAKESFAVHLLEGQAEMVRVGALWLSSSVSRRTLSCSARRSAAEGPRALAALGLVLRDVRA